VRPAAPQILGRKKCSDRSIVAELLIEIKNKIVTLVK